MTAKEKAVELFKKFDDLLPCEGTTTGDTPIICALIAVDEIIKSHYKLLGGVNNTTYKYWQEVKKEIQKL